MSENFKTIIATALAYDTSANPPPITMATYGVTWSEIWTACTHPDGMDLSSLVSVYGPTYDLLSECRMYLEDTTFVIKTSDGRQYSRESDRMRIRVSDGTARTATPFNVIDLLVRCLHADDIPMDPNVKPIILDDGVYLEDDEARSRLIDHLRTQMVSREIVPVVRSRDGTLFRKDWYIMHRGILSTAKAKRPVAVTSNGQVAMYTTNGVRVMKKIGEIVAYAYPDLLHPSPEYHKVYDHISGDFRDHSPWNFRPMTQRQNNMIKTISENPEVPSYEHCSQFIPDRDPAHAHLKTLDPVLIQSLIDQGDLVRHKSSYVHRLGIVYKRDGTRRSLSVERYGKYLMHREGESFVLVHRTVADAFGLHKPDGSDRINHIISDQTNRLLRQDNRLENLEWTDAVGNSIVKKVRVDIYARDGSVETSTIYNSMRDAADGAGIHLSSIHRVASANDTRDTLVKATHKKSGRRFSVFYA